MPDARRTVCSRRIRFAALLSICLVRAAVAGDAAVAVECQADRAVSADLGDGVVMHTCLRQKSATEHVRAGPLLLVKNGIPILRAQTNREGRLHGRYLVWDDDGSLTTRGSYDNGRKHGAWLVVDEQGRRTTLLYVDGRLLGR